MIIGQFWKMNRIKPNFYSFNFLSLFQIQNLHDQAVTGLPLAAVGQRICRLDVDLRRPLIIYFWLTFYRRFVVW